MMTSADNEERNPINREAQRLVNVKVAQFALRNINIADVPGADVGLEQSVTHGLIDRFHKLAHEPLAVVAWKHEGNILLEVYRENTWAALIDALTDLSATYKRWRIHTEPHRWYAYQRVATYLKNRKDL